MKGWAPTGGVGGDGEGGAIDNGDAAAGIDGVQTGNRLAGGVDDFNFRDHAKAGAIEFKHIGVTPIVIAGQAGERAEGWRGTDVEALSGRRGCIVAGAFQGEQAELLGTHGVGVAGVRELNDTGVDDDRGIGEGDTGGICLDGAVEVGAVGVNKVDSTDALEASPRDEDIVADSLVPVEGACAGECPDEVDERLAIDVETEGCVMVGVVDGVENLELVGVVGGIGVGGGTGKDVGRKLDTGTVVFNVNARMREIKGEGGAVGGAVSLDDLDAIGGIQGGAIDVEGFVAAIFAGIGGHTLGGVTGDLGFGGDGGDQADVVRRTELGVIVNSREAQAAIGAVGDGRDHVPA